MDDKIQKNLYSLVNWDEGRQLNSMAQMRVLMAIRFCAQGKYGRFKGSNKYLINLMQKYGLTETPMKSSHVTRAKNKLITLEFITKNEYGHLIDNGRMTEKQKTKFKDNLDSTQQDIQNHDYKKPKQDLKQFLDGIDLSTFGVQSDKKVIEAEVVNKEQPASVKTQVKTQPAMKPVKVLDEAKKQMADEIKHLPFPKDDPSMNPILEYKGVKGKRAELMKHFVGDDYREYGF